MNAAVFLAWFGLYLASLSPGLGGEDSGELASCAVNLGLSHPPGYPLYTLLGKLCSLVPLGSPAFRLNLLSAACAAGALALLFVLVRREVEARFGAGRWTAVLAGALATVLVGGGQALWRQAAISDKYALNILLFGGVWYAAVRGRAPLAALLWGAAFSHHMQALYLAPGLAWLSYRTGDWNRRRLALCAGLFLLGLSPKLLYPPVRAVQDPAQILGRSANIGEWFSYVRAAQYTPRVGGTGERTNWEETVMALGRQTAWVGAVAGLAGLGVWSVGAGPAGTAAWAVVGTGLALTSSLRITGREFYVLPVTWMLAFGLGCLFAWAARFRVPALLVALVPLALFARNLIWAGASRVSLEYDYGRDLLAGLPRRAVFFIGGDDIIYPVFYLQGVEGFRTDVTAVPDGFLTFGPTRARLARENPELAGLLGSARWLRTEDEWSNEMARVARAAGRRVFMTNPSREGVWAGLKRENRDLVFELGGGEASAGSSWMRARGWYHPPRGLTERQGGVIGLYGNYQRQFADQLANSGRVAEALPRYRRALSNPRLEDREGAANNYALALDRAGDTEGALAVYAGLMARGVTRPETFLNEGNLLVRMGRRAEAAELFRKALEIAPVGSNYAAYARGQLSKLER